MKPKLLALLVAASMAVLSLAGCTSATPNSGDAQPGTKPTEDRQGNPIDLPDEIDRIVSTAPSIAEILVGLGLADKLVMIDSYSAGVEGLPADLPQMNFPNVDAEALLEAEPDLVLVADYYPMGGEDPLRLVEEAGICVVRIPSSSSIEGILEDIAFLGAITGADDAAEAMVSEFRAEVERIRAIGETVTEKKTVYFEIGSAPSLYSFGGGTFLNEMIELVGGVNIFGEETGWIAPDPEVILAADPDVILTNEDYLGDGAVSGILAREGWEVLRAVQNGDVYLLSSGETSRASQNAVKALRAIAKAVYPELYE